MIKSDLWVGVFLFLFSFYVCLQSWHLGFGDYHRPGPGFFPFHASLVLGVLALSLTFFSLRGRLEKGESWANSGPVLIVCLAALAFALLLEPLGFVSTVFVFIFFLLRVVERRKWMSCIGAGLLTSVACYVVFQLWLRVQLPAGVFAR